MRLALLLLATCSALVAAPSFSGAKALEHTAKAVSFGPRPASSAASKRLASYIYETAKSHGCHVEVQRFTYETPLGKWQMQNIIAMSPGPAPERPIVISGHYDTKLMPKFVGANDGGSSTGLLLELSRTLCPSEHEVMLVWLDGEEAFKEWTDSDSLYGSRAQARIWKQNGTAERIRALINVDMIGDRDLELVNEWNSTAWLRELVWKVAKDLGYEKHFGKTAGAIVDDHIPFLRAGIPALDLIDFDYGPFNRYWHTERDTLDKLSAESFQVVGEVLLRAIEVLESKP